MSHAPSIPLRLRAKALLGILVLMSVYLYQANACDPIYFVCNKYVPLLTLSKRDVKNIYMGKKTTWSNGQKITFAVLKKETPYGTFLHTYLMKSSQQFDCYWLNRVFSGEGFFPKTFDTDEALVAYVAKTDGAIGFTSRRVEDPMVRQIIVLD